MSKDAARVFDVWDGWELPAWGKRVVPQDARVESVTDETAHTEYDTVTGDLAEFGVALARLSDGGWTLGHDGVTTSCAAAGRGVPVEIRDLLLGIRAGAALHPVRRVTSTRTTHRVLGSDHAEIGEIVDTQEDTAASGEVTTSRVLTVAGWSGPFVDAAAAKLLKAGAVEHVASAAPTAGTVGDALHAYLRAQHRVILAGDLGLRRGENTVHRTRVAIRRLRSAVRIVTVSEAERARVLDTELSWLSGLLGEVRDRQVLRDHLHARLGEDDDEFSSARAAIDAALDTEEATAHAALSSAMAGRRYLTLLRTLRDWRREPPFTADADRPEAKLARYVRAATRDLDRKLAKANGSAERLHRARKAAKRARYVATFAGPAAGKHGSQVIRRAKSMQRTLGDHQDCIVAAAFLQRLGVELTGEAAFGCGVLWEREQERAGEILRSVEH